MALANIGPSLVIPNIEFIFSKIYKFTITTKKSEIIYPEFISGVEYFHQLLHLIKDMASIKDNEKMKKNS